MSLPATIKRYLERHGVPYRSVTRNSSAPIPAHRVVKSIMLRDPSGLLLAVIPADHGVDLPALTKVTGKQIELVSPRDYVTLFKGWGPSTFFPLAQDYGITTLIDALLTQQNEVYFETGAANECIGVNGSQLSKLHSRARTDVQFATPLNRQRSENGEAGMTNANDHAPSPKLANIRHRIERLTELPPMPEMAQKIIHLNANPYAHVQELAAIVELDPSLATQIVRYARSPFFGYRGKINSISDAITRVLGYDVVMNIALGLAAASPFKHTRQGPLGLDAFWRHATYSAALCQSLANVTAKSAHVRPGMAYLSGLLHNFGILLLGHLFRNEFNALNSQVSKDPSTPMLEHEVNLLGVSHTEIGAWLMQAWNMPQEVVVPVREHHRTDYSGTHAAYTHLILLVDQILKRYDIGDAADDTLPTASMQLLGLTEMQVETKAQKLLESKDELDAIVHTLAA